MSADAQAALVELATRFEGGRPSCGHASAVGALRWGPLYAGLGGPHPEYVAAIELMYEGYLLHYRESRAFPAAGDDGEMALLAGDSAYAEGLRAVARRGDVVSVRLLARLMSACAFLRDEGLAFAHDDSLWAYTVAAMAAQGLAEAVSQGSAPHMAPSRGADVGAARPSPGSGCATTRRCAPPSRAEGAEHGPARLHRTARA